MALGVVIQNRDGEIISANPAAERILGLPHENLIGIGSLSYDWRTVKLNGEPLAGNNHPAMVAMRTGQRGMILFWACKILKITGASGSA